MKNKTFKLVILFLLITLFSFSISFFLNLGPDKLQAYFSTFKFKSDFTDEIPVSLKNYDLLNEDEKLAYIAVFDKIKDHPEYIKIPTLSSEEFNNVFYAVKNDNPDILCFADSCNMITYLSASFLQLDYAYDVKSCEIMTAEMNKVADSIVKETDGMSDFEKELYIHDRLVSDCTYSETKNSSTAYGCLVENKAVCSGYSRAAMLLLLKSGIDSMVVAGTGVTPSEGEISHMWNIVWLDNESYHLDVTWDDPVSDSGDVLSHLYFNLKDNEISSDHKNFHIDFTCDSDRYNYFVFNNLYFESYDDNVLDLISKNLCDNINSGKYYLEFEFSDSSVYESAYDSLINNLSPGSHIYVIIDYLSKNSNNTADLTHVNFSEDASRNYLRIVFDTIGNEVV